MSLTPPLARLWTPARHSPWRFLLAAAAVVAAIAHVPVVGEHLEEAPYMGVLFILLTVACLLLAAMAVFHDSTAVYVSSTAVCSLAVIGYAATRLVPFPMLADDVGNWLEPLGIVSVVSELVVVVSARAALRRNASRSGRPRPGRSTRPRVVLDRQLAALTVKGTVMTRPVASRNCPHTW